MAVMVLTEIADYALEILGVKAVDQDSSSADQSKASAVAEQQYDRLITKGLAVFDSSSVPDWAQEPFAALTAEFCLAVFSVPAERAAMVLRQSSGAIGRLTEAVALSKPRRRIKAVYY